MMADNSCEGFWKETLSRLRIDLGEEEFSGWFADVKYLRCGNNSVVIGVPSAFHRDKLKSRYQNVINSRLQEVSGRDLSVEFEKNEDNPAETAAQTQESPSGQEESAGQNHINPVVGGESAADNGMAAKPKRGQHPQMLEKYTFDNFIIGENNNFAANAAIAISRNPGKAYNPFFVYGSVGLGKTHLMQAIGNYIHENSSDKVIYVTSEDFLNEYINGITTNKMNAFKNKFRYTDVLLIDDIHNLEKKPGVQDELFHTFNALLNAKKQLVFTCDRPPSELKNFPDRLISRFQQGLKVDLQPPQYEIRCAILKSIVGKDGALIPDEVIDFIGKNVSSNIRDLIGSIETLIAYTKLITQPLTLEIARQKLRDILVSSRQANLGIETIQRVVADFFNLSPNDLKGKKRNQSVVFPRQIAMFISQKMTEFSTTEIGQAFGGRDHTTVMYSIEKIKGQLLTDSSLESTIENLNRLVKEFIAKS